ncbi:4-(cytidine 5'-diphospho)-2-C-methyl-D-erythritol kinase [Elusimicrobiota bacterium]
MARTSLVDTLEISEENNKGRTAQDAGAQAIFETPRLTFHLRFSKHYPRESRQELLCGLSENLVIKAHDLVEKTIPSIKNRKTRIKLFKNIPVGGGLGGGSSNAACALRGLAVFYRMPIKKNVLLRMAQNLGSDVPFFLKEGGPFWWADGYGERLKEIKVPGKLPCLILYPGFASSTQRAYSLLDKSFACAGKRRGGVFLTPNYIIRKLSTDVASLLDRTLSGCSGNRTLNGRGLTYNSFEEVVFARHPVLVKAKLWLLNNKALKVGLSGSGSCLFAIGKSLFECHKMARSINGTQLFNGFNCYVCETCDSITYKS